MRLLAWLIRFAFFALVLWFALNNTAPVPLHLTDALRWEQVPLILIIVASVLLGALAGVAAMASRLLRLRRRLAAAGVAAPLQDEADRPAADRAGDRLASVARNAGAAGQFDGDAPSER